MEAMEVFQWTLMVCGGFFTLFGAFILFHLLRKDDE